MLHSIKITPPPRPSPTKAAGKKCGLANCESGDDDAFVPRYDIQSVSYNFFGSDDFNALVLQETALKRPVTKSLPLPLRFQNLVVSLFLTQPCRCLFYLLLIG